MEKRHKILILDDDADWLQLSREMLEAIPSHPEVLIANNGKRALSILESEPVRLLLCDLKMPRMDGLQVLAIVRRRHPELRTVVLSGLEDEDYRSRAYSLGVDLFWIKMEMQRNPKLFIECVESLLGSTERDGDTGFRGIQSKSLMDIIQMECLSRASTVLRITRGPLVARLWIQEGELIDAEVEGARGEAAFQRLLSWKAGTFENLAAEPDRERTIFKPVNALLLESAQTFDEDANPVGEESLENVSHRKMMWKLSLLNREGADFVIVVPPEGMGEPEAIGTQSVAPLVSWARRAADIARRLGERLEAGPVQQVVGKSMERQILLFSREDKLFFIGFPADFAGSPLENARKLVASWDS
jgi:CheY-like chemotaxis protein